MAARVIVILSNDLDQDNDSGCQNALHDNCNHSSGYKKHKHHNHHTTHSHYAEHYSCHSVKHCQRDLHCDFNGLAFSGVVILFLVGFFWYVKRDMKKTFGN